MNLTENQISLFRGTVQREFDRSPGWSLNRLLDQCTKNHAANRYELCTDLSNLVGLLAEQQATGNTLLHYERARDIRRRVVDQVGELPGQQLLKKTEERVRELGNVFLQSIGQKPAQRMSR
jgi:hypothetical protein